VLKQVYQGRKKTEKNALIKNTLSAYSVYMNLLEYYFANHLLMTGLARLSMFWTINLFRM